MSTIEFTPQKLALRLKRDAEGLPEAISRGMKAGAQRGRAVMVSRSPVYRGILRNAWKVIKVSAEQVNLENDMPYAGILERGSRPFKISQAGIEALTLWVKRKILKGNFARVNHGPDTTKMDFKTARKAQLAHRKAKSWRKEAAWKLDDEAERIARAIAKKWQREGRKGIYFIRNSLDKLAELMRTEVERKLEKFFNRKGP